MGQRYDLIGVAIATILVGAVVAGAEEPISGATDLAADAVDAAEDSDDELDKWLDLADENVGQLSQVNVQNTSSQAPSLAVEVSTVSRQKSTVGRSPAAVYVVSQEMIRRSGATTLPEVLRRVPGVQVARIDSSKWAVSIRGFNGRFANKLLVQIDGRTVYTPLFGGVFWDIQDVMLEDVERIEVIRGPGASVWGTNAVNGIINVITKSAADTQGGLVTGGAGSEERGFTSARYGGAIGRNGHYRLFGKWFDRDAGFSSGLSDDSWHLGHGGARIDLRPSDSDTVTLQGDYYRGSGGQTSLYADRIPPIAPGGAILTPDQKNMEGGNVLMRWSRTLSPSSGWAIQTYFDHTDRAFPVTRFREERETLDIDFQHNFLWRDYHAIVWGFGYRNYRDKIDSAPTLIEASPRKRADDLFSYFIQDQMTLWEDRWYLTAGSKFTHDDYTGFEIQPTLRLLWTPSDQWSAWASVSRAVRSPSRASDDFQLTLPPTNGIYPLFVGTRAAQAEDLTAYELGLRAQLTRRFAFDTSLFLHEYDDLLSREFGFPIIQPGPIVLLPFSLGNQAHATTYGWELATTFDICPHWQLFTSFSVLKAEFDDNGLFQNNAPEHQSFVQLAWTPTRRFECDFIWRYADSLFGNDIGSYNVSDVRAAWHVTPRLELSVVGRHLFDSRHPEFGFDRFTGNISTEVQSEVYGMVRYKF